MTQMTTFASRLRDLRTERRLSKSGLARAVNVSTTCVWNWEEGNTHPRPGALSQIALALGTTEAFLERGVAPKQNDAGSQPSHSSVSLDSTAVREVVLRARSTIAAAAGLNIDQVKVVLEFST